MRAKDLEEASRKFLRRAELFREAQKLEEESVFAARAVAGLVLVAGVATLWALDALTVKSLVLVAIAAFVVKKFFDFRRNTWATRRIAEIKEQTK